MVDPILVGLLLFLLGIGGLHLFERAPLRASTPSYEWEVKWRRSERRINPFYSDVF